VPRTARLLLPYTPHHVVQRGHNRASVFATPADHAAYLDSLREWKCRLGVRVHAYCLMTNHVHLVLTPGDDTAAVGALMRRLAGRFTRRVNALEGRTGTLWEGRYKASPIQSEGYLLACTRYVELNPVRAGLVADPGAYRWSSYRVRTGGSGLGWLDADECYLALGTTYAQRASVYAAFVAAGVSDDERAFIRSAARRNQLTGDGRFAREVAARIGRRIENRGPGRPRRRAESPDGGK
jgi:REP-associated tyrosine transposase